MNKMTTYAIAAIAIVLGLAWLLKNKVLAGRSTLKVHENAPEGNFSFETIGESLSAKFMPGEYKTRNTTTKITPAQAEALRAANRQRKRQGDAPVYTDLYGNAYRNAREAADAIRNRKRAVIVTKQSNRRRTKTAIRSKSGVKGVAPKPVRRDSSNRLTVPAVNKWIWQGGRAVPRI
jgi:hypothetical protein